MELVETVGLNPEHVNRYPHELSGGQNQRAVIARILAINPEFIVADEPTSALDVNVQAQILYLLRDVKKKFGLTCLFISHDLEVVKIMTDRVAVMYLGKVVEIGKTDEIFNDARHPYTKALLLAIPVADPEVKHKRIILEGEMPNPMDPPPGCSYGGGWKSAPGSMSLKSLISFHFTKEVASDALSPFFRSFLLFFFLVCSSCPF